MFVYVWVPMCGQVCTQAQDCQLKSSSITEAGFLN